MILHYDTMAALQMDPPALPKNTITDEDWMTSFDECLSDGFRIRLSTQCLI